MDLVEKKGVLLCFSYTYVCYSNNFYCSRKEYQSFWCYRLIFRNCLQAAYVQLQYSGLQSVYFCLWSTVDGSKGEQVWGKANSEGLKTPSKHYPAYELHTFGPAILPHTHTCAPASPVSFLVTHSSAGPVKCAAYPGAFP